MVAGWRGGLGLVAQAATVRTLEDAERLAAVDRHLSVVMVGGAAAALAVGWLRPSPLLLVLALVAIESILWFCAVSRFLDADVWGEESPRTE